MFFYKDDRINLHLKKINFLKVIKNAKNTSPGGDKVCYEIFKHVLKKVIDILMKLYNTIW